MASSDAARVPGSIPVSAGIGLRAQHQGELLDSKPAVGWLEVHSENYFSEAGPHIDALLRLREHYPLSLHGVGLSLGSIDPLDSQHLTKLKRLIGRTAPALVSEHLSWGSVDGRYVNDLLPLPVYPGIPGAPDHPRGSSAKRSAACDSDREHLELLAVFA